MFNKAGPGGVADVRISMQFVSSLQQQAIGITQTLCRWTGLTGVDICNRHTNALANHHVLSPLIPRLTQVADPQDQYFPLTWRQGRFTQNVIAKY